MQSRILRVSETQLCHTKDLYSKYILFLLCFTLYYYIQYSLFYIIQYFPRMIIKKRTIIKWRKEDQDSAVSSKKMSGNSSNENKSLFRSTSIMDNEIGIKTKRSRPNEETVISHSRNILLAQCWHLQLVWCNYRSRGRWTPSSWKQIIALCSLTFVIMRVSPDASALVITVSVIHHVQTECLFLLIKGMRN